MDKKIVKVAGYSITQLTETAYEAENETERFDFYFDAADPDAVEVFVSDSLAATGGEKDLCIKAFYAESLEDAVVRAMKIKRERPKGH